MHIIYYNNTSIPHLYKVLNVTCDVQLFDVFVCLCTEKVDLLIWERLTTFPDLVDSFPKNVDNCGFIIRVSISGRNCHTL